eukprot:7671761-Pyramimonas_sp.AAC.1
MVMLITMSVALRDCKINVLVNIERVIAMFGDRVNTSMINRRIRLLQTSRVEILLLAFASEFLV